MEIEPLLIPDAGDAQSSGVAPLTPRPLSTPSDSQLQTTTVTIHKPRSSLFYQFSQILNLAETDFPFPAPLAENQEKITMLSSDLKLKTLTIPELREIANKRSTWSTFYWVDIHASTKETLQQFYQMYGIHQTTCDDLYVTSAERLELDRQYLLLVINELQMAEEAELQIAIFPRFVVTFHHHTVASISRLHASAERLKDPITSPEWIVYPIVHFIMRSYLIAVDNIGSEVKNLNELALRFSAREDDTDVLLRLSLARTKLLELKSALLTKNEILLALIDNADTSLREEVSGLMKEQAHLPMIWIDRLDLTYRMLSSLVSTYLERVSFEVAVTSEQSNKVQEKFNAVGTILLPLLVIQGMFTMNVKVPGSDDQKHYYWFIGITASSVVLLVAGLLAFKWLKWL